MSGVDIDLLATYLRNEIEHQQLSLRKAAEQIRCSPATLSRLLAGTESEYVPDTATLTAAAKWLKRNISEFEPTKRPPRSSSSLAEVELHLHALPDITEDDAQYIMAAVKALYEARRQRDSK